MTDDELYKLYDSIPTHMDALRAVFDAGARAQWIPVSERLPEKYRPVALLNIDRFENCSFDRNIQAAGYLDDAASSNPYWSIRGDRATMLEGFTHWMPLPAAPLAKGEG